jgi:hypothetical protein
MLVPMQAASRTQGVTSSLMQSLVDANEAHQANLEAAAGSQAEAAATLLSAVHSGINQVQPYVGKKYARLLRMLLCLQQNLKPKPQSSQGEGV